MLTDVDGTEILRLAYAAFGEEAENSGPGDAPTYTYTGKEQDASGLMYYGARYYDPALARFITPDTLYDAGPQGLNRYSYALNNPIIYRDPTGHEAEDEETWGVDPNYEAGTANDAQQIEVESAPANQEYPITDKIVTQHIQGTRKPEDIHAIVVHQSEGGLTGIIETFEGGDKKGNPKAGAHFVVTRNGTIYRVADLTDIVPHVGDIKSKCYETDGKTCSAQEYKKVYSIYHKKGQGFGKRKDNLSDYEKKKQYPDRYPFNDDAAGIEFLGDTETVMVEGNKEVRYLSITSQQQKAADSLLDELKNKYNLTNNDIYPHPDIAYKNKTEAKSVKW